MAKKVCLKKVCLVCGYSTTNPNRIRCGGNKCNAKLVVQEKNVKNGKGHQVPPRTRMHKLR